MKKIILIMISVIMLFSACNDKPVQTQIDPAEEFGGITFGMTKDEIIGILGKESDSISESDILWYMHEEFYNVSNATVIYAFDDYGKFYYIVVDYFDSKQVWNDYAVIKETVLKNYPPKTYNPRIYDYGEDDILDYNTENRSIYLRLLDGVISLHIKDTEQTVPNQDDNAET